MALPATVIGGFDGYWLWPLLPYLTLAALGVVYRGFPIILDNFLSMQGIVLGSVTGFGVSMAFTGARRIAGWVLCAAVAIWLLWSTPTAWETVCDENRRLALGVYGVPDLWMCLLGLLGVRMLRTPRPEGTRPDGSGTPVNIL